MLSDTSKGINDSFKYLLASRTMRSVAISFTTSALPLYLLYVLGQSLVEVGATYFLIIIFTAFTYFLFGMLGDRVGYKNTMIIAEILPLAGLTGLAISTFFTSNPSFMLLIVLISAILAGINTVGGMRGGFSAGQQAFIANNWRKEDERVQKLAKVFTVAAVGSIVGSLLLAFQGIITVMLRPYVAAELQAFVITFRYMFVVAAALLLFSMTSLFFLKEAPKKEKKKTLLIKRESSPQVFRVVASQIVTGFGLGLAIPILPAMIAKAYALDATVASQFIGYMFGVSYILIAITSFYMSKGVYKRNMNTVKLAGVVRAAQGILIILIALVISAGTHFPYGTYFGLLVIGIFYSGYALFVGVGAPLRSAINMGGINSQDYGTASAIIGVAGELPQASVGIAGLLSEAFPQFLGFPMLVGGALVSVGGAVYSRLLKKKGNGFG